MVSVVLGVWDNLIFYAVQHNYKSGFYVKGCKFSAKKCFVCLVGMGKTSTFAPAIERDAAVIEILKVKLGLQNHSKNFFWKNLLKSLVVIKIVLIFASAFSKKAIKKSSLKDLDMNKQVVQFLLK